MCLALFTLALVLPSVVTWPGAQHGQVGLGTASAPEREGVPTLVTGRVQHPDGTAAPGAVVVASLGGQAVTSPDGCFEIALHVPPDAPAFHVTAVASLSGASHTATALVPSFAVGTAVDAGTLTLAASAGCPPSWIPTFGGMPGVDGTIAALSVFDDGSGPALYAGGGLTSAGGIAASGIAKWDGSSWSPLGSGMGGSFPQVSALTVFDDGGGPALYAGGSFTSAGGVAANLIAKWDGSSWSPLGSGMSGGPNPPRVRDLAVFDDGGGPALYAGGRFTTAGGIAASFIAKWDGSSWSPLGSGMGEGEIRALTVFDDGGGPALYAGGVFTIAGGVATNRIAKWDGSSWSPLGSGMNDAVSALTVFDDEGGVPALYAGGEFTMAGGSAASRVAKWDGSSWSPLGSGLAGGFPAANALIVFDDGAGSALYAGGWFSSAGGSAASLIAKWDGSSWSSLGSGLSGGGVSALAVFDDGGGPALYAGGSFTTAGGVPVNRIAKWDNASWSPFVGSGMDVGVSALTVFDDGGGPALYAGGVFTTAGGVAVNRIAKWDGWSWSPLGSGMKSYFPYVSALAVFDDGGGAALYAGGNFDTAGGVAANSVAKWDGTSWSPLGSGVSSLVYALAVYDDGGGPALYAGGLFHWAGGVAVSNIARWDGASWSALGSGMNHRVHTLAVFDDGAGPALYAGGYFTAAGGVAASSIAKWDGTSWSSLGSGLKGGPFGTTVSALAVLDDGGGPALYAGGDFTLAGGAAANRIAEWDGASWSPLGSGMDGDVSALAVFDDGGGPALYAGGGFSTAGGAAAGHSAKWDGSSWSPLGSGMTGSVLALTVFDDDGGPILYAGGDFGSAIDSGDSYLAKWGCPSAFDPVPGCHGNPATLSPLSAGAQVGGTLSVQLDGGTGASGTALLFAGGDGTDAAGCGLVLPGYGELLLALAPAPVPVAQAAAAGGSAAFSVAIPASPALVGLTISVQAIHVGALPATPIELSTGLAVTFSG
jgi:hypothetical protein